MHSYAQAAPAPAFRPAFVVTKLAGTRKKPVVSKDATTQTLVTKEVVVDAGYLVKFPKGHSIRCDDLEHLRRLGFGPEKAVALVNDDGDEIGSVPNQIQMSTMTIDELIDETAGDALEDTEDAPATTKGNK